MLDKRDRQGVRTPAGLEQKYDFSRTESAAKDAKLASTEAKGAAAEARRAADNAAKVADEAKSAVDALTKPVDYIVECGELDGWRFEKWNSGKAVCWRTTDVSSVNCSSMLNDSAYYTQVSITFPTGLFPINPSFVSISSVSSKPSVLLKEHIRNINVGSVSFFVCVDSTQAVEMEMAFVIEAKGVWKL